MKNKKLFSVLAALSVLLSACGPSNNNNSTGDSSGTGGQDKNYYDERNFISSQETVTKTKTRFYDGPSILKTSSKVNVNVEGEDLFVYETRVNHKRKFTYDYSTSMNPVVIFDFEGKVNVDIEIKDVESISKVQISPLVYGIEPTIEGKHIKFTLEYVDNYIVEYNDDSENVIHLFTNRFEEEYMTEEEAKKDSSIVYIGPGVYEAGAIPLKSNQTLYISGGAVVFGQIRTENLENVKIKGRGIISGSQYDRKTQNEYTIPVEIRSCKDFVIEDLTFLDPAGWCIALYKSENITMNNVKIATARANGDGISVQSCHNVKVNGGFVRSWDDSLVVKNVDRGTTSDITFDGVSVWTDLAQSMEVGYETYGPTMENITFQNITVMHNFHKPVISLHNCDDAEIKNVTYKNITVEDGQMLGDVRDDKENDFFIDMTIAYNIEWTKSEGERGSVDGVNIENVKVYDIAESCISRLDGESANSSIKNVAIKNIDYAGKAIKNENDLSLFKNAFVQNVSVTSDKENKDILGAIKKLPYKLELTSEEVEVNKINGKTQDGVLVPEFAKAKGELSFLGVKADLSEFNAASSHGAGNKASTPGDDGSGVFEEVDHEAQRAFDGDDETYFENANWKNEDNEFATITMDFGQVLKTVGVIRIMGTRDNQFKYTYSIGIYGRKIKTSGEISDTYARVQPARDYVMSPANGNVIDINISTQKYAGLQIRFFRTDTFTSCEKYKISEIEFYPPSLTFKKAIFDATEHNDVYPVDNVVDGDATGTSYYESKTLPAQLVVDLGDLYSLTKIILSLNPSLLWEARTQNIEIKVSNDNRAFDTKLNFETAVAAQDCLFDPQTGNRVEFDFASGLNARFIKVIINSNSAGSYGGQLAEIAAYGN